ncbi:hypothetical protein LMG22037_06666 [Paraburkholderia phenoliruptrix]|uniref:Uncharacterized protein n=1 Tax=Paraburkholderia phenoliruptrix TaxID=252970 RepID=A0A6J5CQL6_9BURK|nr:hypothetical protein LMG22037_06666 [Paraburkholderia phenoliruptrix]
MPRTPMTVWRVEATRPASGDIAGMLARPRWSAKNAIVCWRRSSQVPDDRGEFAGRPGAAVATSWGVRKAAIARSGFASMR